MTTTATKVFPMMLHTEVINYVAQKIEADNYLEIGVYNASHNFNRVKISGKVGVDPDPESGATHVMTSDQFFYRLKIDGHFDIVFIDGLHHSDQVRKDIVNSWQCLSDGGVIILHDTNPPTEQTTCVPRGSQREWCGDVYKAIYQIDSPEKFTIREDYGITILKKTKDAELKLNNDSVSWQEFDSCRDMILNLVTAEQAKKIIDSWT